MPRARVFVTGGTGFIGLELLRRLVQDGHSVGALVRSPRGAEAVQALGAEPVSGNLTAAGPWQETAAGSDWVIHLAQPRVFGSRVTRWRARRWGKGRVSMERRLFDALDPATTQRVVYVADASYYGDTGPGLEKREETMAPSPCAWGPYLMAAIEQAEGYRRTRNLPIILTFPGQVYGDGSWFRERVLRPVRRGRPLVYYGGSTRWISPIHVQDCARAILHLCQEGSVGHRYFLVDDRPVPMGELGRVTARALGVRLKVRYLPRFLGPLVLGPVLADYQATDCVLSNGHLKALGFRFDYPTIEEGIPAVVRAAR